VIRFKFNYLQKFVRRSSFNAKVCNIDLVLSTPNLFVSTQQRAITTKNAKRSGESKDRDTPITSAAGPCQPQIGAEKTLPKQSYSETAIRETFGVILSGCRTAWKSG